jgi:hypothetical protein
MQPAATPSSPAARHDEQAGCVFQFYAAFDWRDRAA